MSALSKVLIFSASYGEGHQQAAVAVRDALWQRSPGARIHIVDYLRTVHPVLNQVTKYCYLKSVQIAPALWGLFYKGTSQISPSSLIQRQLNSLGLELMERELTRWRPDVVVSTFPTPAGVVSSLKTKGRVEVPLVTVITDHTVHSQWIHPATDLYCVGSTDVEQGLLARGVPADRIRVTGIPVRPVFALPQDPVKLRHKYGLSSDAPVVLVMGGAYGVMSDIDEICEELFLYPHRVQVLVVCGRNERMRVRLRALAREAVHPVRIFGFVEHIHELMALADLMITKAGGLTISEALAMRLPMLVYRPIPGQEEANARFLTRAGVAVYAKTRRDVSAQLYDLLVRHPERREEMRERMMHVRRLHAADEVADAVLALANPGGRRAHYEYHY
jgi:processive 1,2-diacylglycerol beta-glucosyltransferase